MGQMVYVLGLFFIAGAIFLSDAEQRQIKAVQKSRLILEYNWPEPSKNLNRLPHPRSCHHFIHTKHDGSHVIKMCHGDKIFDYRHLRCLNKSFAKCWMNIVKKGNMKKVKRQFSCPFPWGLYPDKEDCTLFYDCMGGKVFPRKCPDSTLFDIVERICVHSSKALCAEDSDISTKDATTSQPELLFKSTTSKNGKSNANITIISTSIGSESPGIAFEESSFEEKSSLKDPIVKYRAKSRNKLATSKLPSTPASYSKSYRTTDTDFKEDNSEENNSSEEVGIKARTNLKNKSITSKLTSFISTSTINSKSFRTTDVESNEDSSEEKNSSEEASKKNRTKSKNKVITSKLFSLASTTNPKLFRTTDTDLKKSSSEEENSSEEKDNEINSKYKLKSTTPKIEISSDSIHINEITKVIIPISTVISNENKPIISSIQGVHSSELPLQSSTIESLVSTENTFKPVITTVIHEGSKTVDNNNDAKNKVSWPTEIIDNEFISSAEHYSHKKIYSTAKIRFTPESSTIYPTITENIETDSKPVSTFSNLCPDFDGYFPHPKNKHIFVACIGGQPTIMECPEKLVFDSNSVSCVYGEM